MNWKILHTQKITSLDEFKTALLKNRGVTDAASFFKPLSPIDLSLEQVGIDAQTMARTIGFIQAHKKESILIFGDYDADGICATAVMWLTLHHLGYQAMPFIPHREKHGYGLSQKALDDILATQKPGLIITVDNGIVAQEPVARLKKLDIPVIITDHHQPDATLPPADEIVHTTQLCGTTVAWIVARELLKAETSIDESRQLAEDSLDLCGIATIADQVKLQAANRSFAWFGIEALKTTHKPGLKALFDLAKVEAPQISATTVNYVLAPRINAMGRLDHALDALRLLCTGNQAKANQLAVTLQGTNTRRQNLTEEMLAEAEAQATQWLDEHIIIVASEHYHSGVIGLIAGRLMEKYHKPAIAMAIMGETVKASARSIEGINIVELIRQVRDDLTEVGGHPMAAGFGLVKANLELVQTRLQQVARTIITLEQLVPSVTVEAEVEPALISLKLAEVVEDFEPFGAGNPKPLLLLKCVKILDHTQIGAKGQHLKIMIGCNDGAQVFTAMGWNMKADVFDKQPDQKFDLVASVEVNRWRGKETVQLVVKDLHLN